MIYILGRVSLQTLRQGQGRLHHQGRDGEAVEELVEGADRQSLRQVRLRRRRPPQLRRIPENDDQGEVNDDDEDEAISRKKAATPK